MEKVDSTELYDGIRLLVLSARQTAARASIFYRFT
jgi:hypothetical protein